MAHSDEKKPMRNSLREKVLLKASVYHIAAFVNNGCLGRGNYVVVRAKPVTSCHYLKSGQSACMFCISYGIQCRQDRRYIAVMLLFLLCC